MTDPSQPPKRTFEPPPWEKEQFEELARRRAEQERADAALDELLSPAPAREREAEHDEEPPGHEGAPVGPGEKAPEPAGREAPALDEKRVAAMLVQLSGEEQPALAPVKRASRVVAVGAAAVGAVIAVIALLVGVRSGSGSQLGAMSGLIGGMIGAALIGVGAWLWIRAKR